eukprot:scaffold23091_cov152-Cylindrotheca_fusiformis.AAC.1
MPTTTCSTSGISTMKSLLLSPPNFDDSSLCPEKPQDFPDSLPVSNDQSNLHRKGFQKLETNESQSDRLIQRASSSIAELSAIHEKLERASVDNAVSLDLLYMTGTLDH